jgi:hypothetical protein
MRHILLFITILFSAIAARANPVATYYELVNEAELLICKERFQYALQHYDKAFALKGMQPWAKDVNNAWLCAFKLGDKKRFSRYSILLIQKNAYALKGPANILGTVDSVAAPAYINLWQQLKTATQSTVNANYQTRLSDFLNRDQLLRGHCIGLYQGEYNIGGRDTLNIYDSLQIIQLRNFFWQEGFPTETRSGLWNNDPGETSVYDIVLLHDRSWTNRQTLDSLLYTEIFKGRYHPYEYAQLKDFSYQSFRDSISDYQRDPYSFFGTNLFSVISKKLYIEHIKNKKMMAKINTTRNSIFLDKIEEMVCKGDYQFKHDYWCLLRGALYGNLDEFPEELLQKIRNMAYPEEEIQSFNTIETRVCRHGLKHR